MELAVELPDLELLALARTAGVQILEVQRSRTRLVPPTSSTYNRPPASSAAKLALQLARTLWPGINLAARMRTPGDAARARAALTWTSA